MPNTKQIEEKTTNKTIECCLCPNKHVSKYLRIVDVRDLIDSIDDLDNCKVRDYCCYDCANGLSLTDNMQLMLGYLTADNKRHYPQLVRANNPNVFFGNVVDPTINRIDEITKHRKRRAKYIKLMKDSGIMALHKKRKSTKKSIAIRVVSKDDDEWWRKFSTMSKVMTK